MQGNLALAAHLGKGQWIILGGDCVHHRSVAELLITYEVELICVCRCILDEEGEIATWVSDNGGTASMHVDLPAAESTISKLRRMEKQYGCLLALSHDASWMDVNNTMTRLLAPSTRL